MGACLSKGLVELPDQTSEFKELFKTVTGLSSRGLIMLQQGTALWHLVDGKPKQGAFIRRDAERHALTLSHARRSRPYLVIAEKDLVSLAVGQTTSNFLKYQARSFSRTESPTEFLCSRNFLRTVRSRCAALPPATTSAVPRRTCAPLLLPGCGQCCLSAGIPSKFS